MKAPIDHLVYATPDLERGMREIEALIGVPPSMGGQHLGRGTRNALMALGEGMYLEIVAPDPAQPRPATARWLGVDSASSSRLTTWAAKGTALTTFRERAVSAGVPLGAVKAATRRRADGVELAWELTEPDPLVADGVIPFFIDWGASPHPAESAAQGADLVDFRLEHPDVVEVERMLRGLDLEIPVAKGTRAGFVAVIEGPRGRIVLR